MKITEAEIITSAVKPDQYPRGDLPEIALAGRSNVGKSSFINNMINRKNLARTSQKPGKTQTLNFYLLNNAFIFVDVPGYGYAKVSKKERDRWGRMIETYLLTRESLRAVVLLVDLRHPPTQNDILMYNWFTHYDIPVIVVATKADKVPKGKKQKQLKQVKSTLDIVPGGPLLAFSAETGEGKNSAWKAIRHYLNKG